MENSVNQTSSEEIKLRQHFTGKVMKISMAAALVDIGTEKPAVLHISQLDGTGRQPIKRVEDVLEVGQQVDVWVRRVADDVIQLTQIKPLELPWKDIKDGMTVKGTIVRLETFGAFVEIGAERPGLVHISEIAHGYVKTPADALKEGEEIEAIVLESNRKKKQIKLSIKALQPVPEVVERVREEVQQPDQPQQQQPRERGERSGEQRPRRTPGSDRPSGDRSSSDRGERGDRGNRRGGGGNRREERQNVNQILAEVNEPADETDTALGAALRAAMGSAESAKASAKANKKSKGASNEQDDILSRTLGSRS